MFLNIDQMHEMLSPFRLWLVPQGNVNWWFNDLCTLISIRLKNGLMTMGFRYYPDRLKNLWIAKYRFFYKWKKLSSEKKIIHKIRGKTFQIPDTRDKWKEERKKTTHANTHSACHFWSVEKCVASIIICDTQWTMSFLSRYCCRSSVEKTAGDLHFL